MLGPWLLEGATLLADTLTEAGPDAAMWVPVPDIPATARFFARRMTHEALIHGADALLALGHPFTADPEIAVDAIEEWLELGTHPIHFELHPWTKELRGLGSIALRATDTWESWTLDRTGETLRWRRGAGPANAHVHAELSELLLILYRRVRPAQVHIEGDSDLLAFALERMSFG